MLEQDHHGTQALGLGRADVIRLQNLEHPGAGQTHDARRHVIAQRDGRHDKALPSLDPRDRQPAHLNAQEEHHDQRKPERRQRLADHGKRQGEAIDQRIRADRRRHAQGDRQDQRKGDGATGQDQRVGQPGKNDVGDVFFQIVGAAQVALQGPTEPIHVLHGDRTIVSVGFSDVFDFVIRRRLAGERHGGIAGNIDQ